MAHEETRCRQQKKLICNGNTMFTLFHVWMRYLTMTFINPHAVVCTCTHGCVEEMMSETCNLESSVAEWHWNTSCFLYACLCVCVCVTLSHKSQGRLCGRGPWESVFCYWVGLCVLRCVTCKAYLTRHTPTHKHTWMCGYGCGGGACVWTVL